MNFGANHFTMLSLRSVCFPGAGVPVAVAAGEVGGATVLIVHLEDVPGEGSRACNSRLLLTTLQLFSQYDKL